MTLEEYLRLVDAVLIYPAADLRTKAAYWSPLFLRGISCKNCKHDCQPLDFCHYKKFEPYEPSATATNAPHSVDE